MQAIVISKTCSVEFLSRTTKRYFLSIAPGLTSWDNALTIEITEPEWHRIDAGQPCTISVKPTLTVEPA